MPKAEFSNRLDGVVAASGLLLLASIPSWEELSQEDLEREAQAFLRTVIQAAMSGGLPE
jgi:hypothetical protein